MIMKHLILLFWTFVTIQVQAQVKPGFYFLLNPNEPFLYYVSTYEEIHDYTEASGYPDTYYSGRYEEFRPNRGIDLDLGYQFSNGLITGAGIRVVTDMFDVSPGFNAVADIGYKFNFPIALHGRGGFFYYSGHKSYSIGGLLDIYFPIESERFEFGMRTGYNFVPVYKNDEYTYDYGDSKETYRQSMTYHYIELGMFFRWN